MKGSARVRPDGTITEMVGLYVHPDLKRSLRLMAVYEGDGSLDALMNRLLVESFGACPPKRENWGTRVTGMIHRLSPFSVIGRMSGGIFKRLAGFLGERG